MALRHVFRDASGTVVFAIAALFVTVVAGFAIHHFADAAIHDRAASERRESARELSTTIQRSIAADTHLSRAARKRAEDVIDKAAQQQPAGSAASDVGIDVALGVCLALLYVALVMLVRRSGKQARAEIASREEQARRDPLTSLPNREQLHDLVHQAIARSGRSRRKVALMLMDLNRFKEINDTLGHHTGDRVLQQLAARLRNVLRESETVARLGGDEFAILLPAIGHRAEAATVAKRILKTLEEPFVAAGLALEVDASIGIALYPDHGDRVAKLLRAADVAMYLGKETLSGYTFFSQGSDPDDGGRRLALVGELRSALDRGELVPYYQPKVELATGRVTGVEALVRWEHPRGGVLAPDEFIPLLEQSSLLRRFTLSVVEMALRDCSAWRADGLDLKVAVNLSMRNLLDSQLPADLRKLVHRSPNLRADALELEITESMIVSDPERIFRVCSGLREYGFQLTVDDFGTGYSSLAYLQRLPVSSLKIDKSFVAAMAAGDADSETIIRSTLDLAHNLGLAVVAEGVETYQAFEKLAALGCDHAQGFLITRPLPREQLVSWLKDRNDASTLKSELGQAEEAPDPFRTSLAV